MHSASPRPVGPVGIDVERPGAVPSTTSFEIHDLLDAFEARQVEHGVEQDAFHDRAQAARAARVLRSMALAGNGAQRLLPPA